VSFSFPEAEPKQPGYVPEQVDAFIAKARDQFANPTAELVTSDQVRNTEFDLVHGGYLIGAVDSAMDRLEDTFAQREIAHQLETKGQYAVQDRLSRIQEILRGRVERPKRRKFSTTGYLLRGYDRKQVDALCESLARHLDSETPLDLLSVRRFIFKAKRGGYVEAQVDAFIDRIVEVLQIEKQL
jgi:DivIVA domain-containing protein